MEQQSKSLNDALDTIMTNNMRQHMKDELRTSSKNLQMLKAKLDCDCATQRFRMKPDRISPKVTVRPYRNATTTTTFTCCMTQLPVNLNDATTGHKLQGTTKDVIIITSWPRGNLFKNWEYVVLSRVRTLNGLYLLEPIDMNKAFKPGLELSRYMGIAKSKEKNLLRRIKTIFAHGGDSSSPSAYCCFAP